ncbi:hypothetical protein [Citrobacter telavivensis]
MMLQVIMRFIMLNYLLIYMVMWKKSSNIKRWLNTYVDYNVAGYSSLDIITREGGPWEKCANADAMFKRVKDEVIKI